MAGVTHLNGSNDLIHRTKGNGAEIMMEEIPKEDVKPVKTQYDNSLPHTSFIAFVSISLLLICCILIAGYVVSYQTQLNRVQAFLLALAVSSDFATGFSTIAIAPAIYLLCKRRSDVDLKNPFIIQFLVYVFFYVTVHLFSVTYIQENISAIIVVTKFLCALFSVTTIGSIFLFLDNLVRIPSRDGYKQLEGELRMIKRKFALLDCSLLCNKLHSADTEDEISCMVVQEIARLIPSELIGSYRALPSDEAFDVSAKTNSILMVSSSSQEYELPQVLPFYLLEHRDDFVVIRRVGDRLLASSIATDMHYEEDNHITLPVLLEDELLRLPFQQLLVVSCCSPADSYRIDFVICFAVPQKLDAERMILLRQCSSLAQFAVSRFAQLQFLSGRAKKLDEDNELLLEEKKRISNDLEEKSKFLSDITQEIRTELVNLQTSLTLVAESDNSHKLGSKLSEDTSSLVSFVSDVVEYAHPSENSIPHDVWEFHSELLALWCNLRDNVAPKYAAQINMASIPSEVPKYVIGDRGIFTRCISTLLPYSMDLVGKGSVLLTVKCLSFNSDNKFLVQNSSGQKVRCIGNVMVQIDFVGSGRGLTSHEAEKLFQPLYKSNSLTHSGLSLAIVRQNLQRAGGRLNVESSPNIGTTFSVVMPFVVADISSKSETSLLARETEVVESSGGISLTPSITPFSGGKGLRKSSTEMTKTKLSAGTQKSDGDGLHILIAEDNLLNQKVLVRLLAKIGHKDVTLVTQGDLAVEAVKEADPPFDLIFMDLHMPVMGGIEACKLIREMSLAKYPQIIACTANAQNDVKAQFSKLDAYAFIPKPINFKKLTAALEEYNEL